MGLGEVGTKAVKMIDMKTKEKSKKEEKTKEKSKKGIADHVNGNGADVAKDSRKGEKEGKKTKKKGVKNEVGTEECNDHFGERDENECGEEPEILSQKNRVGSVIEKVGAKMKGQSMTEGLDRIVVRSGHKMTKRTSKNSVKNLVLTEQEIFETSSQQQQGKSVEAFGEGMIEKEEKRKRKKDKCGHDRTVSEGDVQGHDLNDPKCKRPSTFDERDTVDAIAQRRAVTKDEQKRKKMSKISKGESSSGADLELNDGTNDSI